MPLQKRCVGCGKIFQIPPSQIRRKWCSTECRYNTPGWQDSLKPGQRKTCLCQTCGKTFEAVKSAPGKYCSRHCLGIANGARQQRDPSKWMQYTCEECGKQFEGLKLLRGRKRFCSATCRTLSRNRSYRVARPTSIESALLSALNQKGVYPRTEYKVGRYSIDLAFPGKKLAIEADGDYWHSLPKQQRADQCKNKALHAAGWRVLRFSETEINTNLSGCVARILAELSR